MTTDFSDHGSDSARHEFLQEAANAASCLPLGEGSPSSLKNSAEPDAIAALASCTVHPFAPPKPATGAAMLPPGTHKYAAGIFTRAMLGIAQDKNIAIDDATCAGLSDGLVALLGPATVMKAIDSEPVAVSLAASAINRTLDIVAGFRFIELYWQVEGFEQLDRAQLVKFAEQWAQHLPANDAPIKRWHWEHPATMLARFYKSRSRGPASVRFPDGHRSYSSYMLGSENAARASRPEPILICCPGVPGPGGLVMADGRCVKRPADGVTVTTWWKDGKLHRDPKDGPAFHRVSPEREATEYFMAGDLHRDPAEGPASVVTDAQGRRTFECYAACGELHRAGGPARTKIKDGTCRIEYWLYNQRYRDEKQGPAIIEINEATGRVMREEYWQFGLWHRDPAQGPAITRWNVDGECVATEYWVEGEAANPLENAMEPADG